MWRPSTKFLTTLKMNDVPAYKLAQRAGINPITLSKLIHGYLPLKENDYRILAIAQIMGMRPEEAVVEVKPNERA